MSVDPLEQLTQQPYSYADDDPINESDPTGLDDAVLGLEGASRNAAYCQQNPNGAPCAGTGALNAFGTFVGNHYGQIAEGLAGVGCIAGLQPELCIAATLGATQRANTRTSRRPARQSQVA